MVDYLCYLLRVKNNYVKFTTATDTQHSNTTLDIQEIRRGLKNFVHDEVGTSAKLLNLTESDGHAGLTFLFEVLEGNGSTNGYVIKLPPKGVKRKGNTDVYRQAPLLRALRENGMAVPRVPWAFEENDWFDVPFIVMERLPGHVYFAWDPSSVFERSKSEATSLWTQCVRNLPSLHCFDWRHQLSNWHAPISPEAQITYWEQVYVQAPEPNWAKAAEACERLLLDTLPDEEPVGLFHGDYQPGNILYDRGQLTGIIDWELSGIGAQLLDLGWLMMAADDANWTEHWHPISPPTTKHIRQIYESERGSAFHSAPWYQALAGYRLGCIACLNVKLHRKGQRHDPIWERIAPSVLKLFNVAGNLAATL